MTTGYLYHEAFAWHDTGTAAPLLPSDPGAGLQPFGHLDSPDTKRRIHELIVVSGLVDHLHRLPSEPADLAQVERVHEPAYLERLRSASAGTGGDAGDGISPLGKGGFDILLRAAGAAITTVDAVVTGRVTNGYALVRPSGHHALPGAGMGMAYLNNIAIAITEVRRTRAVSRIAVVDWDAHHGNGAQHMFAADPDVLTISLHQDNVFPPGSGSLAENAEGILNVPLPAGTGDGGYAYAMERAVMPALQRFGPELIVVASGLDANAMDPLARQMLSSAGFRQLTSTLMQVAEQLCEGRIAMVHEGGYAAGYVPFCGLAILEQLSGRTTLADPYLQLVGGFGGQALQPHQRAAVDAAAQSVGL
ncbi:class II histone deacetylase [Kineosporia rhizophila]|uniref:class II histone deacetylase n=1 Tax=Kineosporia TaxID=49184 RepID=UPI001E5FA77A|nr:MULTISPECIES: class II histone deacetylase [Kineosporia]MCE0536469.1 class II histone deacetylase [Kineosporia rhizophila]GLY15437.1 class II histone deacetylase [Kineosporia sp. NBRC 101677]